MLKTALQKLKDLWAAGHHRQALKLAAGWPSLGQHKTEIQRGWAAASNPAFYKQIGENPDELYTAGLHAVAERYGLPIPTKEIKKL